MAESINQEVTFKVTSLNEVLSVFGGIEKITYENNEVANKIRNAADHLAKEVDRFSEYHWDSQRLQFIRWPGVIGWILCSVALHLWGGAHLCVYSYPSEGFWSYGRVEPEMLRYNIFIWN